MVILAVAKPNIGSLVVSFHIEGPTTGPAENLNLLHSLYDIPPISLHA